MCISRRADLGRGDGEERSGGSGMLIRAVETIAQSSCVDVRERLERRRMREVEWCDLPGRSKCVRVRERAVIRR